MGLRNDIKIMERLLYIEDAEVHLRIEYEDVGNNMRRIQNANNLKEGLAVLGKYKIQAPDVEVSLDETPVIVSAEIIEAWIDQVDRIQIELLTWYRLAKTLIKDEDVILIIEMPEEISGLSELVSRYETIRKLASIDGELRFVGVESGSDLLLLASDNPLTRYAIKWVVGIAAEIMSELPEWWESASRVIEVLKAKAKASGQEAPPDLDPSDLYKSEISRLQQQLVDSAPKDINAVMSKPEIKTHLGLAVSHMIEEALKGSSFHIDMDVNETTETWFGTRGKQFSLSVTSRGITDSHRKQLMEAIPESDENMDEQLPI